MNAPLTADQWRARAVELFGPDPMKWKFKCPSCGHVASVQDWKDAGAPPDTVAFSCIGRWTGAGDSKTFHGKGGPCNYAGGGLFRLNPQPIEGQFNVFAFAEDK